MAVKVRSQKHVFQVMYYTPYRRSFFIQSRVPSKVLFRQRSSPVKGRLPSKVVFRQRSSSFKSRLPSMVVLRQRSSSIKDRLPSKVVFRQRLSSVKGRLSSKVFFRQRPGWTTVFLCEYAGPLVVYLWFYTRPWLAYGDLSNTAPVGMTANIAALAW